MLTLHETFGETADEPFLFRHKKRTFKKEPTSFDILNLRLRFKVTKYSVSANTDYLSAFILQVAEALKRLPNIVGVFPNAINSSNPSRLGHRTSGQHAVSGGRLLATDLLVWDFM